MTNETLTNITNITNTTNTTTPPPITTTFAPIQQQRQPQTLAPVSPKAYTYAYWKNGWRKYPDNNSTDILCFETAYFGMELNLEDFSLCKFGLFGEEQEKGDEEEEEGEVCYQDALDLKNTTQDKMQQLQSEPFLIEVTATIQEKTKTFRATKMNGVMKKQDKGRLRSAILMESGRFVQHYEIMHPLFVEIVTNDDGGGDEEEDNATETLGEKKEEEEMLYQFCEQIGIYVWTDSITFNINMGPPDPAPDAVIDTNDGCDEKGQNEDEEKSAEEQKQQQQDDHEDNDEENKDDNDANTTSNSTKEQTQEEDDDKGCNDIDNNNDGWTNTTITLQFKHWKTQFHKPDLWTSKDDKQQLILNCDLATTLPTHTNSTITNTTSNDNTTNTASLITNKENMKKDIVITVKNKHYHQTFDVQYNNVTNSLYTYVEKFKRGFQTGLREIRDYDEMLIEIENINTSNNDTTDDSEEEMSPYYIPFLLYQRGPANIQGLCPILCDVNGTPTGIPIQLSKNFHKPELGWYATFYMMLPSPPPGVSKVTYMMRTAFGFYGTIPTASHANLSLYGYQTPGHNGRWEQLTIGCWGETYCMDMDMSAAEQTVTDVRMLFSRNGLSGNKWIWTDAGWGGDWLKVKDNQHRKLYQTNWKSAYVAHGPCLTDVLYSGYYGRDRKVAAKARVQTLRTDDYARTFTSLEYIFQKRINSGYFFRQGSTRNYQTLKVAWGNRDGLVEEHDVPTGLPAWRPFIYRKEIPGPPPYWIAFPGANLIYENWRGKGWRALIIRSYEATLGGKTFTSPSFKFWPADTNLPNMDLLLTGPEGMHHFDEGDHVKFDAEWITIHHNDIDYYGPNEAYSKHLKEHPNSWETVYREALGNDIQVEEIKGGEVLRNYPIAIQKSEGASEISLNLVGGVGAVPIQFIGLDSRNYTLYQVIEDSIVRLDQSVHGNDFWQIDYDPKTFTFTKTYNLQLDDVDSSSWIFRKD